MGPILSYWKIIGILGILFLFFAMIGLFSLNTQLAECQSFCGTEKFEKDLERDLLFYHDTNRGLHFLDEEGCEWRIIIEPATAYVDCKQNWKEALP